MSQKGPPPGFSKGVNDALIIASNLLHLKAAALLGFALTLSGIVVSHETGAGAAAAFHFSGILLLVASACASGYVIYPMKNTRRRGMIFWGDIVSFGAPAEYARGLEALDAQKVDEEYAYTNYRLSQVLDAKYGLIRWAVALLLLGSALAGAGRILG